MNGQTVFCEVGSEFSNII